MAPTELVATWVERVNAGDAARLTDLYHEDAVNHLIMQDPRVGHDGIRATFEGEFAAADMTCIVEAIHDAGEVVAPRRGTGVA